LACSLVGLLFCVPLYVSALSEFVSGWLYEAMTQIAPHTRAANVAYGMGLALVPIGLASGGFIALRLARAGTPLPRARLAFEVGLWAIALVVATMGAAFVGMIVTLSFAFSSSSPPDWLDNGIVVGLLCFATVSLLVAWGTRRILLAARKSLGGNSVVSS
jgi:hypothetical protein